MGKVFFSILTLILVGAAASGYFYLQNQPKPKVLNQTSYASPVTAIQKSLTLDLTSPDDDLVVFTSEILVSGKTAPKTQVLISSNDFDQTTTSKDDGTFSTMLDLSNGLNLIQVSVFDLDGEQKEATRSVYYSKEEL